MDSSPSHIQTVSNRTSMPSHHHDMLKHSETNLAEISSLEDMQTKSLTVSYFSLINLSPIGHLMMASILIVDKETLVDISPSLFQILSN